MNAKIVALFNSWKSKSAHVVLDEKVKKDLLIKQKFQC